MTTMRTCNDAKAMAKSLREGLQKKSVSITHSESLELVAAQFGFANWNILAARIAGDDTVSFQAPIPIIRIFAVDKAMEFYQGFLGFALDWEHRFGEGFLTASRLVDFSAPSSVIWLRPRYSQPLAPSRVW